MALEEIRPILVGALIGLAALSMLRNRLQDTPARIPVRFEGNRTPQRILVRRLDTRNK